MNNCNLIGYISRDNEVRNTSNDKKVLKNTLAVKKTFKNANGEYDTNFINFVAFGQKAEFLTKYTNKGSLIALSGELSTGSYEREDGTKVYTTEVVVEKVKLLNTKKETTKNEETQEDDPFASFGESVKLDDEFLD